MSDERGHTLLEILIACCAAFFILDGMISLLILSQRHLAQVHAEASMQMRAITIINVLQNSIREAGYAGCMRVPDSLTVEQIGGRSTLKVSRSTKDAAYLQARYVSGEKELRFDRELIPSLQYVISDCRHYEIFSIARAEYQGQSHTLHLKKPLIHDYSIHTRISPWITEFFYLRESTDVPNQFSFFHSIVGDEVREVVVNVNELKMSLLVTKQNQLKPQQVSKVTHNAKVVGVDIRFDVASLEKLPWLAGVSASGELHREWQTRAWIESLEH